MLEFHPLQLDDLPKLRDFFAYSGSRICDTTPGTVFMWRDMYHTEWAIYDGSLYFKVDYPGLGPTFTMPLGGGRPEHFRQGLHRHPGLQGWLRRLRQPDSGGRRRPAGASGRRETGPLLPGRDRRPAGLPHL